MASFEHVRRFEVLLGPFGRIAEDVHVTVAGAARHLEIHRRLDRRRRSRPLARAAT
jgi:hypothetical protein